MYSRSVLTLTKLHKAFIRAKKVRSCVSVSVRVILQKKIYIARSVGKRLIKVQGHIFVDKSVIHFWLSS